MALDNPSILTACSDQWMSRPDDERFTTLPEMHQHFTALRDRSAGKAVSSRKLKFSPDPENPRHGLIVEGQNGTPATMTPNDRLDRYIADLRRARDACLIAMFIGMMLLLAALAVA